MSRDSSRPEGAGYARGVCPVCSAIRRVGAGGLFYRHNDPRGRCCAGSYRPLHEPGHDRRTVPVFALVHDRRCDNVLLAQMSSRPGTLQLELTVGCVDTATGVSVSLSPAATRVFVDQLDRWAQAALSAMGPMHAAAVATGGEPAFLDHDWTTTLPAFTTIQDAPRQRLKARTCAGTTPLLAVAAIRSGARADNAFAVLDHGQVCSLRDGIRLWLDWAQFLIDTGLYQP